MLARTQNTFITSTNNQIRSLPQTPRASRNSSTAAAETKRNHVANYSPLGSLVSRNQVPEAVRFLEDALERNKRVHALAVGDLLEGEAISSTSSSSSVLCLLRPMYSSISSLELISSKPVEDMASGWEGTAFIPGSIFVC